MMRILAILAMLFAGTAWGDTATVKATNDSTIYNDNAVYATSRDATSGTLVAPLYVGQFFGGTYIVARSFLSYAIPVLPNLYSASLFFYGNADQSTTDFDVYVLASTYSTPIATGDYDVFDGHQASGAYNGTVLGTWNSASYSATWNQINLNAAGVAAVLAASNSTWKVALISSRDYNNTTSDASERVLFEPVSTTGKEPYILLTYNIASGGTRAMLSSNGTVTPLMNNGTLSAIK